MSTTTHMMTVEEFQNLPEGRGARQELHHGELITLPPPKLKHSLIQLNLVFLIKPPADPAASVSKGVAFLPLPEHELWVADVAYLSAERFRQADRVDYIHVAPEVVIEVLSPSNSASEILDREQICLANGAKEFWVVDPGYPRIKVTTSNGRSTIHVSGDEVPLPLLGAHASLKVDDVFRY